MNDEKRTNEARCTCPYVPPPSHAWNTECQLHGTAKRTHERTADQQRMFLLEQVVATADVYTRLTGEEPAHVSLNARIARGALVRALADLQHGEVTPCPQEAPTPRVVELEAALREIEKNTSCARTRTKAHVALHGAPPGPPAVPWVPGVTAPRSVTQQEPVVTAYGKTFTESQVRALIDENERLRDDANITCGHERLISQAKDVARAWGEDPTSTVTENEIRELGLRADSAVDAAQRTDKAKDGQR